MEWVIGLYLAWGVIKVLCLLGDDDVTFKPTWMYAEKNPLKWSLCFASCVLLWPRVKIK